jgi:hypothetical protein
LALIFFIFVAVIIINLMQKKLFSFLILSLFLLLYSVESKAGMGPPGPPMGPPPCWPPPCVIPLDGGISLLIAAGLALGGKKFYDFRKKAV